MILAQNSPKKAKSSWRSPFKACLCCNVDTTNGWLDYQAFLHKEITSFALPPPKKIIIMAVLLRWAQGTCWLVLTQPSTLFTADEQETLLASCSASSVPVSASQPKKRKTPTCSKRRKTRDKGPGTRTMCLSAPPPPTTQEWLTSHLLLLERSLFW